MKKFPLILVVLLGLSACNTMPTQSHVTASGQACHRVGYSFSPMWVSPDGKMAC
jgi:hypothetical protein